MDIYSIYKATNKINGKVYIGFDSNWPKRQKDHKKDHKKIKGNHKFYNAIKKYGWNNFEWSIIYQSKDAEHTLKSMEPFFIKEFNSYVVGYNSTLGGEGTLGLKRVFTTEHIQKLSMSKNGRKRTEEELLKFSKKMKGKKQSVQHVNNRSKKYVVINEFLCINKTIINLNKFCRENKLSSGAMCDVANGKRKQHNGWKCYYA
jgi:group I intron endonuclease